MFDWLRCWLCSGICKEVAGKVASQYENQISDLRATLAAKDARINVLQTELNALTRAYKDLEVAKTQLIEDYRKCRTMLAKLTPKKDKWEEYWNNKYPKKKIIYTGRTFPKDPKKRYGIDVRYFFTISQPLYELVEANKLHQGSFDDRALNCLKWVHKNFKYVADKTAYGSEEYWAFPCEALHTKKGDCDDGSILLANLMLHTGIPYWRIRLNAGDVEGGGHCYVTYCREMDNQFVVLDWCYWYNDKPVSERPLHRDERKYYAIWFSWNQRYAFGRMDTMAGAKKTLPVVFKRK